ncbi:MULTISPECIES: hypothetical protein [Enterobacteriaceae]|uniref:hypothetical protein n=1 Tax=Enterobacteriaceae TaxID=543 RepID=UPI002E2D8D56|nr:hypothetical protein [Klebsiella pneumoniae]MED6004918.1 hypothetical protein [Klebsiella pneumoniae]MED6058268.1 hypothetical protein [Klebsiella pneumoniae]
MTIEEIRKKAPEGATHYNQNGDYFCVLHFIFHMWNPCSQEWFATRLLEHDILKPL